MEFYGPQTEFGQTIHAMKYRSPEETFDGYCVRYARTVTDNDMEFRRLLGMLRSQLILPAGRQQLSVGRPHQTTAFNCFVGPTIEDSIRGIYDTVTLGALTMRSGGGVGWDFSTIRPCGDPIRGLGYGAFSSGPVSFMGSWNAMCATIMSAAERRGAMMGVVRCDHPDVLRFVNAKKDSTSLTNFNISVAVTDTFMEAVKNDGLYQLSFGGLPYGTVRALDVWSVIMENNWDYAEPGVLFIDRINKRNPLWYCEVIAATNPCAEQPLPPNGCCLLGSINIVKLLVQEGRVYRLDLGLLDVAVDALVRACDNVIDRTKYPLQAQQDEEMAKRRMGIGVTGMANALEILRWPYASEGYLQAQDDILERILHQAYRTSIDLAVRKGPFPLFDREQYLAGSFIKGLPDDIIYGIWKHGIRNGLLTSIAPTGTISLAADNVSSGIEPVFQLRGERDILTPEGKKTFHVNDYALEFFGVEGTTANQVDATDHVNVLCRAQRYVDSSISKTCNVNGQIGGSGPGVPFAEFKELYMQAYDGGAKSCSTFNLNGKRMGIMRPDEDALACVYDPDTGMRSCE